MKNLSGAIRAMEVYKIISKIPTDEIEIDISDKKWNITARDGKIKMEVSSVENKIGKLLTEVDKGRKEWADLSPDFFEAVKACFMKDNMSDFKGVFVNDNNIICMDTRRMNYFYLDNPMEKFWISNASTIELLKFNDLKKYAVSDNWVSFIGEDQTRYSCSRMMDNNYPLKKIIELMNTYKDPKDEDIKGKLPKSIRGAAERASVLSMDLENAADGVQLNISQDCIEIISERSTGNYKEQIDWEEKPEQKFETLSLFLDTGMIAFGMSRSTDFFLHVEEAKGDKPRRERMVFRTDKSRHVMSLYKGK
jgi:hypothetical protein